MAYLTLLRRPNDESYVANRLIDDQSAEVPVVKQNVNNTQNIIVTIMCGTFDDIVRVKRFLQDSEYCHEINDGTSIVQEGLNLWNGQISGLRFLPIGEQDDGEYTPGFEI